MSAWRDRKRTLFGLPLSFTTYSIDDDHQTLRIEKGLLIKHYDRVAMYRVTDVSLRRTLGDRLFRVGRIEVSSSDRTMGDFVLGPVKHSMELYETMAGWVEEQRQSHGVRKTEFIDDEGGAF